jgi:PAT family beta-lactamase induction signal transducer AmpG
MPEHPSPLPVAAPVRKRSPWAWVPSLYFAEGIPYVVVMTVSVIMYKRLGISNTDIALYTSWLYLPWVIKPFWSPIVDVLKTKRLWIVAMQLLIGAGLAGVAFTIPMPTFFQASLAFLWLLAFSSATHDIAADGFYMLALSEHDQAWFVGIRSTFYRLAMITGQGLLIILAGSLESATGLPPATFEVETMAIATEAPPPALPAAGTGEVRLVLDTERLAVALPTLPAATADSLLAAARAANIASGHTPPPEAAADAAGDEAGWWSTAVSGPLGGWLARTFGAERGAPPAIAGNLGVVGIRLSEPLPAGETAVVNLRHADGDKSIKLAEGERLEFTAENWDQPAQVVIQLDPKLDAPSTAAFEALSGNIPLAWSITFFLLAGLFVGMMAWHQFALPRPASDHPTADQSVGGVVREFFRTFATFFTKPGIWVAIPFILFYRFAEAQLVKLASPFLLDSAEAGGLALTTGEVGFVYGTVGILFLTLGGIVGGILAARDGLRRWLWPMVLAINVPNAVYLYLATARPDSFFLINAAVAVEQFGYGFGFTAFLLYLIYISDGEHKTAHYAICTGLMALGMMIPGMFSGWVEDIIGYQRFFVWVLIATIPSFVVASFVKVNPEFGKKRDEEEAPA